MVPERKDSVTMGKDHRQSKRGGEDQANHEMSQSGQCRIGSRARLRLKRGGERGTIKVKA